jgi:hypothetical protein
MAASDIGDQPEWDSDMFRQDAKRELALTHAYYRALIYKRDLKYQEQYRRVNDKKCWFYSGIS